jgi:hypothetical protein
MTTAPQRKRHIGRTLAWLLVVLLAGLALGTYLSRGVDKPVSPEPAPMRGLSWVEILNAPACAIPVIAITLTALGFTVIRGYYGIQRLEAQRRLQAAEAAEREEEVRQSAVQTVRRQLELNDLTVNLATGEEVARLMEGPDGQLLLVRPGLATKPVSRFDPDEVREDSDQVRVAAMLANASRYGRGGRPVTGGDQSNLSLKLAALAMLNQGGAVDQRLPGRVRVLSDEEVRMLEDKDAA